MNNDVIYASLIYLIIFRLAVIGLGGVSIWLGYRLFIEGFSKVGGVSGAEGGPTVQAKFGQNELTLKNAAPGIFFAAFGSLITVSVLLASPPAFEQQLETTQEGTRQIQIKTRSESPSASPTKVSQAAAALPREALKIDDQEDPKALFTAMWSAYDKGVAAARKAVDRDPENADYQEVLGLLYAVEGGQSLHKTVQHLERALALNPDREDLTRLLELYRALAPTASD